jgi:hypothetical protein
MLARRRRPLLAILLPLVFVAACSGGDDETADTSPSTAVTDPATTPVAGSTSVAPTTTDVPVITNPPPTTVNPASTPPPTTEAPQVAPFDFEGFVTTLASDEFSGRNDGTEGWQLAQDFLVEQLGDFAEPAFPDQAGNGYVQAGASANVVGIVRGSELPDEYVVVGAHYDHLGDGDCETSEPADTICNGATDNAAGVAAAIAVARHLAVTGSARSIVIALWDREEDGLLGSADFIAAPPVALDQIVAYINFDNMGSNPLPSLRSTTVLVGAESGSQVLVEMSQRAIEASSLTTVMLSRIFGQDRSDHANFINAGIPAVFFTDATNGCYHTAQDDADKVDFAKLEQEATAGLSLAAELAASPVVPQHIADTPLATYEDAVAMLALTLVAHEDFALVSADTQDLLVGYIADLQQIVAEGAAQFDDADVGVVLTGAAGLVSGLTTTECDGYLDAG